MSSYQGRHDVQRQIRFQQKETTYVRRWRVESLLRLEPSNPSCCGRPRAPTQSGRVGNALRLNRATGLKWPLPVQKGEGPFRSFRQRADAWRDYVGRGFAASARYSPVLVPRSDATHPCLRPTFHHIDIRHDGHSVHLRTIVSHISE
jgi:hypothetical protein